MNSDINLVVMLTYNDCTAQDAYEIFDGCKSSKAKFWGFKEKGLSKSEMKRLCSYMKKCGKTTVLEVVAYSPDECLREAKNAFECGFDILMGTIYHDSVNSFCREHNIKYMPFVGHVGGRPSVLTGDIDGMISEAKEYLSKGVYGFDLLGYRYIQDADSLISRFVKQISAPVCVAGSVDSFDKLEKIKTVSPWGFTIGGAFFDRRFGETFAEQINNVHNYMSIGEKKC